jgi:hypothetical protein
MQRTLCIAGSRPPPGYAAALHIRSALRGEYRQEMKMMNRKWKVATILGVVGAIALSAASAEARVVHHRAPVYGTAASDAYAYAPSHPNAYGRVNDGVGYSGSGTFSDGREVPGTNWNPNQE